MYLHLRTIRIKYKYKNAPCNSGQSGITLTHNVMHFLLNIHIQKVTIFWNKMVYCNQFGRSRGEVLTFEANVRGPSAFASSAPRGRRSPSAARPPFPGRKHQGGQHAKHVYCCSGRGQGVLRNALNRNIRGPLG